MKKLRPIILAVFVGSICALFLFKEVEKRTVQNSPGNVVAIQIGVFKDSSNAEAMSDLHGGKVFKDGDVYRVYYSILNNDDNIEFITDYLNRNGVNYYLKNLSVDRDRLKGSQKIEEKMRKEKEIDKLSINKELLDYYKEVV